MFSIQCSNDFTDDKWRVKPGPTLSAEQPGYFQFVRIHTFNAKILTVWFHSPKISQLLDEAAHEMK